MDFLSIAALALRSLQVIGNNPALGGGSMLNLGQYSELIGIFAQFFERGDEALDELKEFADIVGAMAEEGRNPTREEWDVLKGRSDTAHSIIQEAAAAAEEETVSDEEALRTLISTLEDVPEEERSDENNQRLAEAKAELESLTTE